MEEFSEKLRETRRELNLSQKDLSDIVGVSGKTVYRWETGESCPSIKQKEAIAEFLGLRKDYFYNNFEQKNIIKKDVKTHSSSDDSRFKRIWTIILSILFGSLLIGLISLYVFHRINCENLSVNSNMRIKYNSIDLALILLIILAVFVAFIICITRKNNKEKNNKEKVV